MTDRMRWLLVVEQAACSNSGLSPDSWYPVSASADAARREAAKVLSGDWISAAGMRAQKDGIDGKASSLL